AGRGYGAFAAHSYDSSGNTAGMIFLPEGRNDRRKVPFACVRNNIRGAWTIAAHAHVERPVEPKGKSALRFVDLHGRQAEVEDDAVSSSFLGMRGEIGEAVFNERKPAAAGFLGKRCAGCDCMGVAIEADDAGARCSENKASIAAGAESPVYVEAAALQPEPVRHLACQHGNVASLAMSDSPAAAASRHSRTREGCSAAAVLAHAAAAAFAPSEPKRAPASVP